jgi:hypothetical protein
LRPAARHHDQRLPLQAAGAVRAAKALSCDFLANIASEGRHSFTRYRKHKGVKGTGPKVPSPAHAHGCYRCVGLIGLCQAYKVLTGRRTSERFRVLRPRGAHRAQSRARELMGYRLSVRTRSGDGLA